MPKKDSRHLLDRLAEIEDPRNEKGRRHPLNSILGLNIIGFMSGHKEWTSTAKWHDHNQTSSKLPKQHLPNAYSLYGVGHWSIENKSHWIRDAQPGEDASPVRYGAIPQVMAALRNAALAVLRFAGVTHIADKIKYFASKPLLAVNLINECF